MIESADILDYIEKTYGKEGNKKRVDWSEYSTAGATASHGTIGGSKKAD